MEKICKHCGKEFETKNKKGIFCSKKCIAKSRVNTKHFLGKKHTPETIDKLKKIALTKKSSFQKGHTPWNKEIKGIHLNKNTEFKKGQIPWNKNMVGYMAGEKNSNWMGGLSYEPYGIEFNKFLKEKIKSRDNHTCQECGITEDELNIKEINYNKKLRIHHINYCKQNNSPFNLISLCLKCHWKTNYNREHWEKYFKNKIFIKELFNPQNILIFDENKKLIGINKIQNNCKEGKNGLV